MHRFEMNDAWSDPTLLDLRCLESGLLLPTSPVRTAPTESWPGETALRPCLAPPSFELLDAIQKGPLRSGERQRTCECATARRHIARAPSGRCRYSNRKWPRPSTTARCCPARQFRESSP